MHGLGANPATTWFKNEVCWLSDPKMLPAVVPNARIWTFNFESMWWGRRSTQNLESLGNQLRRFIRLTLPEVEGQTRPIVFVAHSFGGLVVARALTLPSSDDSRDPLLEMVSGIVFLGTPFRGSHGIAQARQIALAARAIGKDSSDALLDAVVPGSEELLDLTDSFSRMASDLKVNITCFYEEHRTNILKGSKAMRRLGVRKSVHLVPREMGRLEAHKSYGLNASHTEMNEYDNPKDGNYILVSTEIREMVVAPPRKTRQPKPLFLVPYRQNSEFVGREDVLNKVQRRLGFKPNYQARVAIWGLGGIGKTQIATRYAYSIKDAYAKNGTSIFFIRAATRERFSESYMYLARKAGIDTSGEPGEDNLRAVADWLEDEENGRWLMILDNADDVDLFEEDSGLIDYIPQCDHGSILITSRDRRVCDVFADSESSIFIDKLSQEECRNLFKKHLPRQPVTNAVEQIIAKLECHPLALTRAVRSMRNNWTGPMRYLQLHDDSESSRMKLLSEDYPQGANSSQHSIAATLVVSFNQIREQNPYAADLLAFMSYLDRQDIPRDLLPQGEHSPHEFDAALGILQSYAMITESSNGAGFDMHGLIQLMMRNWLRDTKEDNYWLGTVLKVLSDKFPTRAMTNLKRYWPLCRRYLPHALSPLEYILEGTDDVVLVSNWEWLRLVYQNQHTEMLDEEQKKTKLLAVVLLVQVSAWYEVQGDDRFQETQLQAAWLAEGAFGIPGSNGNSIPGVYLAASEHRAAGKWEAIEYLRTNVVVPYKSMLGCQGPGHIALVENMAFMLSNHGWKDEAIGLRRELVDLNKKAFGPESIESLTAMLDCAAELVHTEEGLSSLEEVVRGFEKVAGENEFATVTARYFLTAGYVSNGRMTEAREMCLRVFEGHKNILGPNHRKTLGAGYRVALLYHAMGQLDEARKMNLEVFKKQKSALGAYHEETRASQELFEELNPGSMWRHQVILQHGLDLDEQSERLIAGLEEYSGWKGGQSQRVTERVWYI